MNSTWFARNGGMVLHVEPANIVEAMADNVEQDGLVINRANLPRNYLSAKLVVIFTTADLANSETVSFVGNVRSADNSGMSTNVEDVPAGPDGNAQADQTATIWTSPSTGGPHTATILRSFDFDISRCRQFLQAQFKLDASDGTPASGNVTAIWVFAGADGQETFAAASSKVPTVSA